MNNISNLYYTSFHRFFATLRWFSFQIKKNIKNIKMIQI